jgi:hypothetical protein
MEEPVVVSKMKPCKWQDLYEAALLELNPEELQSKIEMADEAIRRRSEELMRVEDKNALDELRGIADAQQNLRTLRRMELRSPAGVCLSPSQSNA